MARAQHTIADHRLIELRKAAGLTQDDVARRAGTTRAQVANLENGRRQLTLDWMRRLATALDCTAGDILTDRDKAADTNPHQTQAIELLGQMPPLERARAINVLRALAEPVAPTSV